jgi:hypothetical protein
VKFSRKTILLSNILINPKNPRFDPVSNQTKAIEQMLDEKEPEIKKLAEDILEKGLNPSKNLIVLEKNNKFLTLEGNRRIISLKLLQNPRLSKDQDLRKFFYQLKDNYSNSVQENVNCVVFENEEDARHWISLEHTGKNQGVGVDSWDSEQKHRFSQNASKAIQIFDFADEHNLDRQKVKTTNLERVLTPYGCTALGISFSDEVLQFDKTKTKVKENFEKVFEEMSKPNFKVGDIYNKEIIEQWLDETLDIDETKKSTPKNQIDSSKTTATKTKKTKKSTLRKHLIPNDYNLEITPSKIRNIFVELKDDLILEGSKATPNAVGVLFRVFLEISINHYLDKKHISYAFNTKLKEKIHKVTSHMVNSKIAMESDVKYMRNTSNRNNSNILSVENFHEYVHSKHIRPVPGDLKAYWDNTEEFFKILWENV